MLNTLKKISCEDINPAWPHVHLILLQMAQDNAKCYLYFNPITYHKNPIIPWTGVDFLKIAVLANVELALSLEKYVGKEKAALFENKVLNIGTFKSIWVMSTFLDSDKDIRKEVYDIFPKTKDKLKFIILCLPLFIPASFRRIIITKLGYMIKGKDKTERFLNRFNEIKEAEKRLLTDKATRRVRDCFEKSKSLSKKT